MSQPYKLIFVLNNNQYWGNIIEAYRIEILKNGLWSFDVKKIVDIHSRYLDFELNEIEKTLLEKLQITREENIYKQFELLQTHKSKIPDCKFTESTIDKYILPFVSKHTAELLNFIKLNTIELYRIELDKQHFKFTLLELSFNQIEPDFKFVLKDEKLIYTLNISKQNETISLQNIHVVTCKPCYISYYNVLFKLPEEFDGKLLKPFLKSHQIIIPKEKINVYLRSFVSKIIKAFKTDVSGFSIQEFYPKPIPVVRIVHTGKKKYAYQLYFKYDETFISEAVLSDFVLDLSNDHNQIVFNKIFRDKHQEKLCSEMFQQTVSCTVAHEGYIKYYITEGFQEFQSLVYILTDNSQKLEQAGFMFELQNNDVIYHIKIPVIEYKVSGKNDWFDLKITVTVGDYSIPFVRFIPYIRNNTREFPLDNTNVFIIPDEWYSQLKHLALFTRKLNSNLVLHRSQFSFIQALEKKSFQFNKEMLNIWQKKIPVLKKPEELQAELRPYQQNGFEWLVNLQKNKLGACLADDMGLGKTIQILAYFLYIRQNIEQNCTKSYQPSVNSNQLALFPEEKPKKLTHLIVCPLSLIQNWIDEMKKFAPSLSSISYVGPDRFQSIQSFNQTDIILTSYGIIRNDFTILSNFEFHTIVLDESQFIKNPESKTFEALMGLKSEQRFILTGTPLENSLTDLWTQMSFINPQMLGTISEFKNAYVIPYERKELHNLTPLHSLIQPYILRRTKHEVATELPPVIHKVNYCTMTEEQKSFYETKKSEIRNFIIENNQNQKYKKNIVVLSGLTKLRLIANHPLMQDADYEGFSGKFEEICLQLDKALSEGNKIIIFSQFVKHLNIIREYIESKQVEYTILTGQTKQTDRMKNIDSFQNDPNVRIFLSSIKAGGVGINLTAADYVFILDPWWNPAVELQAINRAHRIGQEKTVIVYRFITVTTIEEKIAKLQLRKSELFKNIVDSEIVKKFTEKELMELLN